MADRKSDNWHSLPLWLKGWFFINFLDVHPTRNSARRVEIIAHLAGFGFCLLGFISEAALAGGLMMLATAYFTHLLVWQGDHYGIWYEAPEPGENRA